jgi:hypothetical protein
LDAAHVIPPKVVKFVPHMSKYMWRYMAAQRPSVAISMRYFRLPSSRILHVSAIFK